MNLVTILTATVIASIGGHYAIKPIIRRVRTDAKLDKLPNTQIAGYIGIIERALYVITWYLGQPEFVAVWLVFKVAYKWNTVWEKDEMGRSVYNVYILGTGLSILVAVFSVILTPWIISTFCG